MILALTEAGAQNLVVIGFLACIVVGLVAFAVGAVEDSSYWPKPNKDGSHVKECGCRKCMEAQLRKNYPNYREAE